jgi:hypothetical protein
MSRVPPAPAQGASMDDILRSLNAMHECLHSVQTEAQNDRKVADEREELRRDRHQSIKDDLANIGRRVGVVERWQGAFAKSFGIDAHAGDRRAPKRVLGIERRVVIGWIVTLAISAATGPVGYFIWFKVFPAAIHAALSVAP